MSPEWRRDDFSARLMRDLTALHESVMDEIDEALGSSEACEAVLPLPRISVGFIQKVHVCQEGENPSIRVLVFNSGPQASPICRVIILISSPSGVVFASSRRVPALGSGVGHYLSVNLGGASLRSTEPYTVSAAIDLGGSGTNVIEGYSAQSTLRIAAKP